MMQLPEKMRALIVESAGVFRMQEVSVPVPRDGQVLIRVMAAPINPSDMIFLHRGAYSGKALPAIAGFEGSGVVVQSGGGLMGWRLVDKRVAFVPLPTSGTYAQFALASSSQCMPVDDDTSFEHAAMSFVNPLTVVAMLDIVNQKGCKAVIVTAAASALGRMLNRFFVRDNILVINVVRKEQQRKLLQKEGCSHVLLSEEPSFEEKLKEVAESMKATICFDAIGGQMSGRVLKLMPKYSTVYVYGVLSEQPTLSGIDVGDILVNHKVITGLFLPNWLESKSMLSLLPTMMRLGGWLKNELRTQVSRQYNLDYFYNAVLFYRNNMTQGKVIIKPWDLNVNLQNQSKLTQEKLIQIIHKKQDSKVQHVDVAYKNNSVQKKIDNNAQENIIEKVDNNVQEKTIEKVDNTVQEKIVQKE